METPTPQFPSWLLDAVFYEIYPQSFYDSDGDGIGDLEGVIAKLDYVVASGFNAIWLNPFYQSPMRDAGYDVADFKKVDPRYGDNDTAARLFAKAKELGLRVIIDLVPGHTSIDHPWFEESSKPDAKRPYKNWYVWTDSTWNNGGEAFRGGMVHGYCNRDGNYLSNFFWSQPALNFGFAQPDPDQPWQLSTEHEDVQKLWKEMRSIMRYWLSLGASGFRVDMADTLIRNDPDHHEIRRFWGETRQELLEEFPDMFLIAEGHPSNLLDGTGFHAAFVHWLPEYWQLFRKSQERSQAGTISGDPPYFSKTGQGDFRPFLKAWQEQYQQTHDSGLISLPSGNHDLPRLVQGQSDAELELIYAFVLAWPGLPFFYYGDEIGLRQQSVSNPVHEGHYPPRNGSRTPMQWDSGKHFGFSTCSEEMLYLPVDPDPDSSNVATNVSDLNSIWNRLRRLIVYRKATSAFEPDATIQILSDGAPGAPLIFLRSKEGESVLCCYFPANQSFRWELPKGLRGHLESIRISGSNAPVLSDECLHFNGSSWAYINLISS